MDIKSVFMIVIILILLYIVVRYVMSPSAIITSLTSASTMQTVPAASLDGILGTTSTNFTYSIWFYLDDWNYKYGNEKILFARSTISSSTSAAAAAAAGRGSTLDCIGAACCDSESYYDNSLNVCVFGTAPASSATRASTVNGSSSATSASSVRGSSSSNHHYTAGSGGFADTGTITSIIPNPCPSVVFDATQNNIIVSVSCFDGGSQSTNVVYNCTVNNFPIQSWVNLLISVYGRALDIYLDGKLVKTCVLPGIPNIDPTLPLYITPNGGFSGWTSTFQYLSNATNPQEAWNIYQNGYGSSMLSSLFNSYSIKLALMSGSTETNSISV